MNFKTLIFLLSTIVIAIQAQAPESTECEAACEKNKATCESGNGKGCNVARVVCHKGCLNKKCAKKAGSVKANGACGCNTDCKSSVCSNNKCT